MKIKGDNMQAVSISDFNNNFRIYNTPVQIVENGIKIGKFIPQKSGFFARLFAKKDDTVDGIHRPTRRLKAAFREAKKMEKHPERYKTYNSPQELWDELGL